MEKTSKITKLTFKNEWANPKGGSIFYHDIELENGDKGQIGAKEQNPFKLSTGQSLTYTIEGTKIKAVVAQNSFMGGAKKPLQDPRVQFIGFSHAYAKDLAVCGKIELKDLSRYSDIFFNNMIKLYKTIEESK